MPGLDLSSFATRLPPHEEVANAALQMLVAFAGGGGSPAGRGGVGAAALGREA